MENITYLVLVSDGSRKGIQVVSAIHHVAANLVKWEKAGVIFNRIRPGFDPPATQEIPPVLAVIGDGGEISYYGQIC